MPCTLAHFWQNGRAHTGHTLVACCLHIEQKLGSPNTVTSCAIKGWAAFLSVLVSSICLLSFAPSACLSTNSLPGSLCTACPSLTRSYVPLLSPFLSVYLGLPF